MAIVRRLIPICAALLLTVGVSLAQQKPDRFDATAFGQSTQLGRQFNVKILIESYSTPQDQQVLLDALQSGGTRAVYEALDHMPVRGRISTPWGTGYVVTYTRVWQTPTGRKIRLVTNRPIAFAEAWGNTRSRDYSVSAVELEVNDSDVSKTTGTLLPAIELKIDKKTNQIEIEAFQNPWRLGNFINWGK